jgi:hypothetical protein
MTGKPAQLTIELLSDTTFGTGEETPGVVDAEIEYDKFGLPMIGGKALRGLLRNSWLSMQSHFPDLHLAARRVLGPVADLDNTAILAIGSGAIEERARGYFVAAAQRQDNALAADTILSAFTDIRMQTSEDRLSGAPARTTLRSTRVLIRGLKLAAPLAWLAQPSDHDLQCLALAALGTRQAGLSRNRGRGHIQVLLDGDVETTHRLARGPQ